MKKFMSLLLSFVLLSALTYPAFASNEAIDLDEIAETTIQITEKTDDTGTPSTTFDGLDRFTSQVHLTYPSLSDYEIATFILDYTGQEYHDLPEEQILEILDYTNITTSISYIKVDDTGAPHFCDTPYIPFADWTSTDGYMKIVTSYSYTKTVNGEKYYAVSSSATWLKYPAVALKDAFTLGTSGEFDDKVTDFGSVNQNFTCLSCSKKKYRNRSVNTSKTTDEDLTLDYSNFVPALHFTPISPRCDYCGGSAKDSYFNSYIKYGVIANRSINLQAGYGHMTVGVGSISIGIDANGTPNFSISGVGTVKPYVARAVTISF